MPESGAAARTTPSAIQQEGPAVLGITWGDGVHSQLDVRELRLACGCAVCVDEWTGEHRLDPASVPQDVHPTRIEPVGRYAIQLTWRAGHASGIYPFARLRQLADGLPGA